MRFFVTGASGWLGSAVVPDLLGAGHQVVALARSDGSAATVEAAGATAVRGGLDDLDVLGRAAADADGVIHLAFKHDIAFSGGFGAAAATDRAAVEAMAEALDGSGKPLTIASGVMGLAPGRVATEDDGQAGPAGPDPAPRGGPEDRLVTGQITLALARRGIRSSVLRLPPTCHGPGDGGFVARLAATAREAGVSAYVGDGYARWPATHRLDVAAGVRLAVEAAPAGSTLHLVAEEGVPTRDIAGAIGRALSIPTRSVDPADALDHFGFLGGFLGLDSPASSARTRALLGWSPTRPGLLADIDAGAYGTARARATETA